MSTLGESNRGPQESKSYDDVKDALHRAYRDSAVPAVTLKEVVDRSDYSRATVHERLKEINAAGECNSGKKHETTYYWPLNDNESRPGVYGVFGTSTISVFNVVDAIVGRLMSFIFGDFPAGAYRDWDAITFLTLLRTIVPMVVFGLMGVLGALAVGYQYLGIAFVGIGFLGGSAFWITSIIGYAIERRRSGQ